jgi:hypothetical protein
MMRNRGSVPIAVSMSANRTSRAKSLFDFLGELGPCLRAHSGFEQVSTVVASISQFYNNGIEGAVNNVRAMTVI